MGRKQRANLRPKKSEDDKDFPISIRLSPLDEREAKAIEVLKKWEQLENEQGQSYSRRYIVTRALLALENVEPADTNRMIEHIDMRFKDIEELIEGLRDMGFEQTRAPKAGSKLPGKYLNNLAKAFNKDRPDELQYVDDNE